MLSPNSKLFTLLIKINTSVFFVVPDKCFVVDMALKTQFVIGIRLKNLKKRLRCELFPFSTAKIQAGKRTSLYRLDASKSNTTKNSVNYNYSRLWQATSLTHDLSHDLFSTVCLGSGWFSSQADHMLVVLKDHEILSYNNVVARVVQNSRPVGVGIV